MQNRYAPVQKKPIPIGYIVGISILLIVVIIGSVVYFSYQAQQEAKRLKSAEKAYLEVVKYEKQHPLDFKALLTKIDESNEKVKDTSYESKLQDKELNIHSKQDVLTKADDARQEFNKHPTDYAKTMKEYGQLKNVAQKLESSEALTGELERRMNQLKFYRERYAIVVSEKTSKDSKWLDVVNALKAKHDVKYNVKVFNYKDSLNLLKSDLSKFAPKYICFVATPEEISRGDGKEFTNYLNEEIDKTFKGLTEEEENPSKTLNKRLKIKGFIPEIYQLTRELDDDPYGDAIWAILTGYEPEDALKIAKHDKPLKVKKALSGKFGYIPWFKEGKGFSEREQGKGDIKKPGEKVVECKVPDDATKCFVDELNSNTYDFFDTCGHAIEHAWMIGFKFESGMITHKDGQLYGVDLQKNKYKINTDNPKIYYGEGNCLIGNIDQKDCMVTSWIHSGGAHLFGGYIVLDWFGFMGWDIFWHFIMPGDFFTFQESFYITNQTLILGLEEKFPELLNNNGKALRGYLYERDTMALYGDPAWDARMDKEDNYLFQPDISYIYKGGGKYEFTFKITSKLDNWSFDPTGWGGGNSAGALLPFRITNVKDIKTDSGGKTVITDNFVLMQVKGTLKKGDEKKVTFTAELFKPVSEP